MSDKNAAFAGVTEGWNGTRSSKRGSARGDLTQGPIGKTLLAFALPTLASSIIQSLNGTVNAICVGRFLGEDALAATSNANMVMFLLIAFVFGFGMASTILVGQAWGRKDVDQARRVFGTAGIVPAGDDHHRYRGLFPLVGSILKLLGTPPDATPLAHAYLSVIFLAMPPLLLLTLLMMALRGAGDSMTPLWFMILSVVLDSGLTRSSFSASVLRRGSESRGLHFRRSSPITSRSSVSSLFFTSRTCRFGCEVMSCATSGVISRS